MTTTFSRRGKALYIPISKRYHVESETNPKGEMHQVDIFQDGRVSCTCFDFCGKIDDQPRYQCKHIRLILAQRKGGAK